MIANVMQLNCPTLYGRIVAEISAPHLKGYIRQGQRLSKEYPLFIFYLFIYLFIYLF